MVESTKVKGALSQRSLSTFELAGIEHVDEAVNTGSGKWSADILSA
jgi:hypothetical protein